MFIKLFLGILFIASFGCIDSAAKECKLLSCKRIPNMQRDGIDLTGQPLSTDFGDCEGNYSNADDCEVTKCSRICQPRAMEVISVHKRENPTKVETVIKSCYAPTHACRLRGCERKPAYIFIFTGSAKYKQRVDVGKCVGVCQNADSSVQCVPIKITTKAFDGPNGAVTLDVIEKCSCVSTKCYRVDYLESYTERVTTRNKNETTTILAEKLINIGKCIGSCSGVTVPARCLPSPDNCLLPFGETPAHCAPLRLTNHTFTDQDDKKQTVYGIGECGCTTG